MYTYVCVNVCVYVYVYAHVYIYMYMCICTVRSPFNEKHQPRTKTLLMKSWVLPSHKIYIRV